MTVNGADNPKNPHRDLDDRGEAEPQRFSERRRLRRGVWTTTLNLTPMIDIVFLLLFFFMVVSRFGVEGMLPAHLPSASAGASTDIPRTPLRIRFSTTMDDRGEHQITIDTFHETPLSTAELAHALKTIQIAEPGFDPDTPVHLIADDSIPWQDASNAYNAAQAAGYHKVHFVE